MTFQRLYFLADVKRTSLVLYQSVANAAGWTAEFFQTTMSHPLKRLAMPTDVHC